MLKVPVRGKAGGSSAPTKAVILVSISTLHARPIAERCRWEDQLVVLGSDHSVSMFQRLDVVVQIQMTL